jgi:hypothetical protein
MNMSLLTTIAALCSAVEFSHERLQNAVLKIVHDELILHFKPKAKIEDMKAIYEKDGKIPAIKEWRTINDGMGLKDAKDAIEDAAKKYDWQDYRVGKICTIYAAGSNWDGCIGEVSRIADNGFYVKFKGQYDSVFFHQSAVTINR